MREAQSGVGGEASPDLGIGGAQGPREDDMQAGVGSQFGEGERQRAAVGGEGHALLRWNARRGRPRETHYRYNARTTLALVYGTVILRVDYRKTHR